MKFFHFFLFFSFLLIGCGTSSDYIAEENGAEEYDIQEEESPDGPSSQPIGIPDVLMVGGFGDSLPWGYFIRFPYETTEVRTLPIPIYLASFDEGEKEEIIAGIETANRTVGFDVFKPVDQWEDQVRVIYKVEEILFNAEELPEGLSVDFEGVVGYTYLRNIYIDEKYDAGRVVTDWAMEIRGDRIDRWVVAHELGHAMGMASHALIDYENDSLLPLQEDSLMAASISSDPALDDYTYMMEKQGEILLQYMTEIGADGE